VLQLSLAILMTLTLSLVTPHTFHPRRCCCCCLQLVTMPLCEHPWSGSQAPGTACDYKLHCRISIYDNGAYSRMQFLAPVSHSLDLFVIKHIALFLWTTNLEAVSVLLLCTHVHLSCKLQRPHQFTHSTPSFSTTAFSAPPPNTCPAYCWYRPYPSACKISPSYDAAFRRR